jgi:hypothetical protein
VRKSAVASTCIQLHAVDIDVVMSIRRSFTVSDLRVGKGPDRIETCIASFRHARSVILHNSEFHAV